MVEPAVWREVDEYWNGFLLDEDPVLDAALAANVAAGLPPIDVSAAQGKLLHLLARSIGASRILEVGTLGGYSTIWLARALRPDGQLVTCEIDPHHAEVAAANVARAGLASAVDIRVGPAIETLASLEGPFDLAFIDADKASNVEYFQHALRMSRPGGMIVIDNVVRGGAVVDAAVTDPNVMGVRRLAAALAEEKRVEATAIQTVGAKSYDGFVLAVVR
ncbi:O-methyltransferase [Actinomycetes bacterium KLBMP 9759]